MRPRQAAVAGQDAASSPRMQAHPFQDTDHARTCINTPTAGEDEASDARGSARAAPPPPPRLPRITASHARNMASGTATPATTAVRTFLMSPCASHGPARGRAQAVRVAAWLRSAQGARPCVAFAFHLALNTRRGGMVSKGADMQCMKAAGRTSGVHGMRP